MSPVGAWRDGSEANAERQVGACAFCRSEELRASLMAKRNYIWVVEWKPDAESKWLSTCDVALTRADADREAKGWRKSGNKVRVVKYTSLGKTETNRGDSK